MCSPCLLCENRDKDKSICSEFCKKLKEYQKELDYCKSCLQSICCYEDIGEIYDKNIRKFINSLTPTQVSKLPESILLILYPNNS